MSSTKTDSNTTATTQFLQANGHSYAYRRFGSGSRLPLLFLQHFTGTLDNWDPAVTDPLASRREVILFDNAAWGAPPATFRRQSPEWRDIRRHFSKDLESRSAMSSGTPSKGWSRFKWCRTGHRFFGG